MQIFSGAMAQGVTQAEVEVKVERRADFFLNLDLSLNLPESWRTFSKHPVRWREGQQAAQKVRPARPQAEQEPEAYPRGTLRILAS
jgi:hypothetical protein